jgi:small conductance mechanosensitive channel
MTKERAMDFQTILPQLTDIATKLGGAIVLWLGGRFVIKIVLKAISASMVRSKVDKTLAKWIGAITNLMTNFLLAIAILSVFGVETTSFAALLAAAGLAIGAAWAGLLSNFAAGVFLILFKPFKVGDLATVGGVTGRVTEIGVFATTVNTADNVATIIGNGAISTAIIANYSQNEFRILEVTAQLKTGDDALTILDDVRMELASMPNVLQEPPPTLAVAEINEHGPKIVIRTSCEIDHFQRVRYEINAAIVARMPSLGVSHA